MEIIKVSLADQMNMFMSTAGGLSGTSIASFSESLSTSTLITPTKQYVAWVTYDGIYSLRVCAEKMSDDYFRFYGAEMD